jgi:hypothetical protein
MLVARIRAQVMPQLRIAAAVVEHRTAVAVDMRAVAADRTRAVVVVTGN